MSRDGFHLVYDRIGTGPAVVLLHGWPGDRTDYAEVVRALAGSADVVVPDRPRREHDHVRVLAHRS